MLVYVLLAEFNLLYLILFLDVDISFTYLMIGLYGLYKLDYSFWAINVQMSLYYEKTWFSGKLD